MIKPIPEAPHIGQILKAHIKRHRYYQAALARDIGTGAENVADYLKRPDNRIHAIWKICFALNYNFLSDLAAKLPPTMPCAPTVKDQRIAELEKQLEELRTECHILQRVVDVLSKK